MTTLFRRRRPAGLHAAEAHPVCKACSPMDYGKCTCPKDCGWMSCTGGWRDVPPAEMPRGIATRETLAALVAKAEAQRPGSGASDLGVMGATPTLPHTLPWRNGVPAASEVIPFVPLTVGALIYDGMGGGEKTARDCAHCGALGGREDWSWRYDALSKWSCPACQAQPEWHAPSLPGLRTTTPEDSPGSEEAGIMARSLLATNQRCVRRRPDGSWVAVIPVGGRIKPTRPLGSETEAVAAYGYVLAAFAGAAGAESAA